MHPLLTLFVVLLISVSISLPAGLWIVRDYLSYDRWVWPTEHGFNAFLKSDIPDSQITATAQTIKSHETVTEVYQIPKEVALQEFLTAADLPDVASELDDNPLPNTLTVYVRSPVSSSEVEELVTHIRQLDAIDTVSYDPQIIVRFSSIQDILDRLLWLLSGTFAAFALFVTVAAVYKAIEERVHEVRVLYVLGSPTRLMRGSFLWCGAIYGGFGGYAAAVLLSLALLYIETPLQRLTESYGITRDLQNLDWLFVLAIGGIGVLLGLVSAYYSTWRYLRSVTKNWMI